MLLICAATAGELAACPESRLPDDTFGLVTGVGIPATFAGLRLPLPDGTMPELILNIGIAGAYPGTNLAIGDIVLADGEVYGDVGFELPGEPRFQPVTTVEFGRPFYVAPIPTRIPASLRQPNNSHFQVHIGRGCTVNTCTGTEATGRSRATLFHVAFETMEGAAIAQIGQMHNIPVCEIRAISNFASRREMRPENIRLALTNLTRYLETCDLSAAVQSLYDGSTLSG